MQEYLNLNHIVLCCGGCHSPYLYSLDYGAEFVCPKCGRHIHLGVIPLLLDKISAQFKKLIPYANHVSLYARAEFEIDLRRYNDTHAYFLESIDALKSYGFPYRFHIAGYQFKTSKNERFMIHDSYFTPSDYTLSASPHVTASFQDIWRTPHLPASLEAEKSSFLFADFVELASLTLAYNAEYARLLKSRESFFYPLSNNDALDESLYYQALPNPSH